MGNSYCYRCEAKFIRLFVQQFVNMLDIIKTVVDEKAQLRDDAQLVTHAFAQIIAYCFFVGRDVF